MDQPVRGGEAREASLVRPYSLTSGRTIPAVDIALEALIQPLAEAFDFDLGELTNEARSILSLSSNSPSIAEIAVHVGVPVGVARVLVADLVEAGHVRIQATLQEDASDAERRELIERVLSGLRGI
jgi:Protein of unknown function (DUF742)